MAKKKKSQLKPVARGFATTSVPKKPTAIEEVPPPQIGDISSEVLRTLSGDPSSRVVVADSPTEPTSSGVPNGLEYDSEKAEEQSLQNLVDKYQEKTEKEITRTIKVGCCDILMDFFDPP